MSSADPLEDYLSRILSLVDKFGWAAQAVGADEDLPGFVYTVGRTAQHRPELLIFGIPYEQAHAIFAQLVDRELQPGAVLDDVLQGGFKLAVIPASTEDLAVARRLYGQQEVTCQQIVWPDDQGRFPWDDGFTLQSHQPLRGAPPT